MSAEVSIHVDSSPVCSPRNRDKGKSALLKTSHLGADPLLSSIMSTRDQIESQEGTIKGLRACIKESEAMVSAYIVSIAAPYLLVILRWGSA